MISNLIAQVENDEIVLPAIQRDFVWNEQRITMMFDSIMRGYPLGIALLWETYLNIKYREFNKDSHKEIKYSFRDNDEHRRIKLVLDGTATVAVTLFGSRRNSKWKKNVF